MKCRICKTKFIRTVIKVGEIGTQSNHMSVALSKRKGFIWNDELNVENRGSIVTEENENQTGDSFATTVFTTT